MSHRFVLVGSVNAGKSSIFNRLIWSYRAIVTDIAGTTRDFIDHRLILPSWPVIIMDTPGIDVDAHLDEKTTHRIHTADTIIFVLNVQTWRTAREDVIHDAIVRSWSKNKTRIVINKIDCVPTSEVLDFHSDCYAKGYTTIITTHTNDRSWVVPLLKACADRLTLDLTDDQSLTDHAQSNNQETIDLVDDETNNIIHSSEIKIGTSVDPTFLSPTAPLGFAFLGKPNAGKSSLTNMLAQAAISRVDAHAGTTRDYISYHGTRGNHEWILFDTAGLRKKGKRRDIEAIAYEKTMAMIGYLRPIIVYVIDSTVGPVDTDYHFLSSLLTDGHCLVFWLNKTDIATKEQITHAQTQLHFRYPHFPIVPLSAHDPSCRQRLIQTLNTVRKNRFIHLKTSRLNKAIINYELKKKPTFPKSKICKVLYITQSHINPTRLIVFVNHRERLTDAFKKRIENAIREEYPLQWVPILFTYKERSWEKKKTPPKKHPWSTKKN